MGDGSLVMTQSEIELRLQLMTSLLIEKSKQVQREIEAATKEINECLARLGRPIAQPIDLAKQRELRRPLPRNGGGDAA